MEKRNTKQLLNFIDWYKEKIDYNGNCKDMNEYTRDFIEEFGCVTIPPPLIIEKKLVNYMKSVGHRFNKLKKDADLVARKWQQQADLWLADNNITEKYYLEQLDRVQKTNPHLSPRLNGAWKANQRNSGSDERQNYHSSSSQEVESPDSQRANQRSTSMSHRSNHHQSFVRKSSSPLQLENSVTRNLNRNLNPAEYNANLSIDPKEVTPSNKLQESPVKPDDRFCVSLKEKMFKAVKKKESILEGNLSLLLFVCKDVLKLPVACYPEFLKDYRESIESSGQILKDKSGSGDGTKSLNGKTVKKPSTHMPNTAHNNPSTSQQGARESSRNCPESKHDRKRKHMESIPSVVKAKELRGEQQHPQENKNLPSTSQGAMASSRSCPGSKHDRKRKHTESPQSIVSPKQLKLEQQLTQKSEIALSMSQQATRESSRICPVSKHDKKRKLMENSQSVVKTKELKQEQQHSQDSKQKQMLRTENVVKSKDSKQEQQLAKGRVLKCKETFQSVSKAYEFKDEYQLAQDIKSKLDSKQAFEVRNCDKSHIKKRDSPDQSALLAITSSKKERTSLYHGGRKSDVLKLKDLCIRTLHKAIKHNSDPTKFINKYVSFEILEPVLVLISPDKLQKLEEEMDYLKADTDGVWKLCCDQKLKSQLHLKKKDENWRTFYQRCCMESEEKLRNVAASISALKTKPDRQIKFTTVDGNPTKRQKTDHAMVSKNNVSNSAIKPLPNSCHPSNSRSDVPVPAKGLSNHIKSSHKIKKDAPLMHKAKKTMGQLHRIRRS